MASLFDALLLYCFRRLVILNTTMENCTNRNEHVCLSITQFTAERTTAAYTLQLVFMVLLDSIKGGSIYGVVGSARTWFPGN